MLQIHAQIKHETCADRFMSQNLAEVKKAVQHLVGDVKDSITRAKNRRHNIDEDKFQGAEPEKPTSHQPTCTSDGMPHPYEPCLLYTSDAADEEDSVDLGGRRIIKKKKNKIEITYDILTE
eukprot:TRINITY_DN4256_c0_g1_i7.p2 TRINITY_DN4256_c0_g1~~TRINITY_DN4256_c0_g1_i7.p2  ORF type:complete len:121 (+),score=29.12 TRINITY_DN4256_c0_g1_i7:626-988(+)